MRLRITVSGQFKTSVCKQTMDIDEALTLIETKYGFEFKDKQSLAIKSIINGKDTFVVLPTGYGKSKIYMYLPEIFELVRNRKGTVLVISPLQSLMLDQLGKLNDVGITATCVGECQTDKSVATTIGEGKYSVVFSSPEAALIPGIWRRSLTSGQFHNRLMAVVIDEAHCVTEWGGEFRQEYGKLSELRSVVSDDTTFAALTATATKSMKTEIMKKLDMIENETVTVCQLPERTNITYLVKHSNRNLQQLDWLLNDLKKNRQHAKKTIVYCRNIAACASLYEYFNFHLKQSEVLQERLVAMFHRCTAATNKEHVLGEFPKLDSVLRIVLATVAFGMGVDIPDVDYVIHWGAPRGLEEFAQESGRAGRDGRQSISCIYYSGIDIAKNKSTLEMREFCKSSDCLRDVLNKHFTLEETQSSTTSYCKCKCCSVCASTCECGSCASYVCLRSKFETSNIYFSEELAVRNFSDKELSFVYANLIDFRDCLIDDGIDCTIAFNEDIINTIVANANYLMCEEDVISLGLPRNELASDILELIEEIEEM